MITQDAYGHAVTFSTDGTTDTYSVGNANNYTFPAGTIDAVVAATLAIQANMIIFNAALTDYINTRYTLESRSRWMALYLEFQAYSQPKKLAYVTQLLAWGNAISTYTSNYIIALMAMTNPTTIAATKFDPSQFSADPQINLVACMTIVE